MAPAYTLEKFFEDRRLKTQQHISRLLLMLESGGIRTPGFFAESSARRCSRIAGAAPRSSGQHTDEELRERGHRPRGQSTLARARCCQPTELSWCSKARNRSGPDPPVRGGIDGDMFDVPLWRGFVGRILLAIDLRRRGVRTFSFERGSDDEAVWPKMDRSNACTMVLDRRPASPIRPRDLAQ